MKSAFWPILGILGLCAGSFWMGIRSGAGPSQTDLTEGKVASEIDQYLNTKSEALSVEERLAKSEQALGQVFLLFLSQIGQPADMKKVAAIRAPVQNPVSPPIPTQQLPHAAPQIRDPREESPRPRPFADRPAEPHPVPAVTAQGVNIQKRALDRAQRSQLAEDFLVAQTLNASRLQRWQGIYEGLYYATGDGPAPMEVYLEISVEGGGSQPKGRNYGRITRGGALVAEWTQEGFLRNLVGIPSDPQSVFIRFGNSEKAIQLVPTTFSGGWVQGNVYGRDKPNEPYVRKGVVVLKKRDTN